MKVRPHLIVAALVASAAASLASAADGPVDFSRDILPILSNKCFVCHGPDTRKKDLVRLDSFEAATRLLEGGASAIDLRAPLKSEIPVRIHSADDPMPPAKAAKQLTAQERAAFRRSSDLQIINWLYGFGNDVLKRDSRRQRCWRRSLRLGKDSDRKPSSHAFLKRGTRGGRMPRFLGGIISIGSGRNLA